MLKTTQSGYVGYLKDKFTLLPETTDRIAATSITATWRYEYTGALAVPFCERVSWKLLLSSMQSITCCQVQHVCRAALKMLFQCDPTRSTALALPLPLQSDSVFCGSCCHHQSTTCAALLVPVSAASPGLALQQPPLCVGLLCSVGDPIYVTCTLSPIRLSAGIQALWTMIRPSRRSRLRLERRSGALPSPGCTALLYSTHCSRWPSSLCKGASSVLQHCKKRDGDSV